LKLSFAALPLYALVAAIDAQSKPPSSDFYPPLDGLRRSSTKRSFKIFFSRFKVQEHLLINSIRSDELRVVRLALPEQLRHVALLLYDAAESLVDPFHAAPEVAGPVVLNFVAGLVVGVHDV
jgi:hypothetical protein